jgi:HEAT repeat protein
MLRVSVFAFASLVISSTIAPADSHPPQSARDAAWAAIDHGLHSGYVVHREQAVAALSTIDPSDQDALHRVLDALKSDNDPRVRRQAALALGQMKARQAIPELKAALQDTPEVAFAAAKSLTDLGDQSGQAMLVAVLSGQRKDTPGMMTNAKREAEKRLHHPQGLFLMGAEDATGAFFGPAGMGLAAVTDAADLHSKGEPGRAAAAAYLTKDPDPYAVTLLEWALNDDSSLVRAEAAKGLGTRGNAQTVGKLVPLLHDDKNLVRTMAAASIIRLTP